jgi:hypothetical protein
VNHPGTAMHALILVLIGGEVSLVPQGRHGRCESPYVTVEAP